MSWLSNLICKQGQLLLENERYAILHAVLLALLPYTAWLSVALVALMTLRKGWRKGVILLIPALCAYFALSCSSMTMNIALVNALLVFMPTYIGACVLRFSTSWRVVASAFFLQIMIAILLLQMYMPEFITAQYLYIQAALRELQSDSSLLALINSKSSQNQMILANYLLGIQAIGIVFSAGLSLLLARSIQSQLFCPGGFKQEMLAFRGDKIGFLLLVIVFVGASLQNALAMSLFPILLFYFMLAGLSLSFNVFAKHKPLSLILISIASLILLPFVMVPVYIIFGSLDSLFNFRLYLLSNAGKTI